MKERLITFWVGEQIYGMPLLLVGEFGPSMQITPVESVDKRISGISHLRESSAVVLNMRKVLKTSGSTEKSASELIYVVPQDMLCKEAHSRNLTSFAEPVVLEVDRLGNIIDCDRNEMHPTPAHLNEDFYDGVYDVESGDLILLNFTKLIDCLLYELNEAQR
jgi:chemotaxis signal transduction protein